MKNLSSYVFTEQDRIIISSQIPFIDCLSAMFGSSCEIVLHSFESLHKSVIHVVNGHSIECKIGAPVTNIALEKLSEFKHNNENWSVYFTNSDKGNSQFKSSSTLITNNENIPIGMICMNYSLDISLHALVKNFYEPAEKKQENFSKDVNSLVLSHLEPIKSQIYANKNIPSKNKVQEIVKELNAIALFEFPITNKIVSNELGISSATIYKHLRALNKARKVT